MQAEQSTGLESFHSINTEEIVIHRREQPTASSSKEV